MKIIADLHIHSNKSFDCLTTIETIESTARKHGINAVAITDHDVFSKLESKKDFLFIPAVEFSTDKGHILGLFLEKEPELKKEFNAAVDEIRRCGGLAGIGHPYQRTTVVDDEVFKKLDFIEVFNSRNSNYKIENSNELAKNKCDELIMPYTAGSDAHFAGEIGLARIVLETDEFSLAAVKKAIISRKGEVFGEKNRLTNKAKSAIIKHVKAKEWVRLPKSLLFYIYCLWVDLNDMADKYRKKS